MGTFAWDKEELPISFDVNREGQGTVSLLILSELTS